jgi:ATP phosphoribosyltransferase
MTPTPPKRQRASSIAEEQGILIFAIPKKGRLFEQCADLLKGCGLRYTRNPRLDIAYVNGPTLKAKLVFLPAHDIARFVGEGNVDLGLTGQDMVAECGAVVDELLQTGFGICQLAVQAPKVDQITDVKALAGKRVATSFPHLTSQFFKEVCEKQSLPMPAIRTLSGSVEAACALGLADAVVDLVETGTTMEEAGLEKIAVVLKTQAVLIANKHSLHKNEIETIRKRMEGYLYAQQFCMMYYNITRANLAKAEKITPGRQAPTISPLDDPNWVSVGAMVPNKEVADVMDRLQELGAKDIICMNIDNCRA